MHGPNSYPGDEQFLPWVGGSKFSQGWGEIIFFAKKFQKTSNISLNRPQFLMEGGSNLGKGRGQNCKSGGVEIHDSNQGVITPFHPHVHTYDC